MENPKDKIVAIAGVVIIIIAIIAVIANANKDDEENEIETVLEEEIERPEVIIYNESIDDEVWVPTAGLPVAGGGTDHKDHPFQVDERATHINITLDGDEGVSGQNDLDMELFGAREGRTKSSAGGGPDEHIELFHKDVVRMGYGEYTVRIKNFAGEGRITYNLLIEIYSNLTNATENSTEEISTEDSGQYVTEINLQISPVTRDAVFYRY